MIGTNNARSEGRSSLCSFDIQGSQVYSSFVWKYTPYLRVNYNFSPSTNLKFVKLLYVFSQNINRNCLYNEV